MSEDYRLSRRDAVKLAGAGLVATTFVGSAAAHGGSGGSGSAPGHAYVEYERGHGRLSAIGVHIDGDALEDLPEEPAAYPLGLPRGNTGHFSYVGLDWNPEGHPPGDYLHPHFDVHFYLPSEDEIAAIPPGLAAYDIPDELMPANTVLAPVREVVPGMGEHLFTLPSGPESAHSVPQDPGNDGWSVFIWGAYDMDGDGEGRIIFMEPMVTVAYLEGLNSGDRIVRDIPMPERFYDGGWYPTEFVVAYDGSDYTISLETFEHFPGYDG
jgi:hypothetical protein